MVNVPSQIEIISKPKEFHLIIDGHEINNVEEYTLTQGPGYNAHLTLHLSVPAPGVIAELDGRLTEPCFGRTVNTVNPL